jgi:branched-chain amino acid transport system permease protein
MTTTAPVRGPSDHADPPRTFVERVSTAAQSKTAKRFVACILTALVIAVMTGPSGSALAPTSGITGSLAFPRVWWFIGLGVAMFLVLTFWAQLGSTVKSGVARVTTPAKVRLATIRDRAILETLVIAFGFIYVTWISPHDTWKGGLCIQIGASLLVMELVVYLWGAVSLRAARLTGYAFIALYGMLAAITGPVSHYLNKIGAVPHNRPLGVGLLVIAAALYAIEALLVLIAAVHNVVTPKRARLVASLAGLALLIYGFLMWTSWSQWDATTPNSFAHWLSAKHLLVHDHSAGLTIMAIGALLIVGSFLWIVAELLGIGRQARPPQHVEQFGISRRSTRSMGTPALTIVALLVAVEWPLHMDPASQSNLVTQIAIYVLLALGLNVVVGFAGLLDLGYVAFYAIGAYTAAYFTGALPIHPPFVLNPFFVIPFAIVAAMLAGVLLGTPTLRLRGDYLAIVTLGFGEVVFITANNLTGITGGPSGTPNLVPSFSLHIVTKVLKASQEWSATSYMPYYYLILAFAVLFMIAFTFLEHSKVGRSWTAIREDEVAADSLGVNALKYKVMAFAIGASTAGFAGVFLASQIGSLYPADFQVQLSITVLVIVIFGGMGSLPGAVVGAIVIQGLPAYLQQHQIASYNPEDFYMYLGALLIVMMIFRPQGIIASRRRRREIYLTEHGVVPPSSGSDAEASVYDQTSLDSPGYISSETE